MGGMTNDVQSFIEGLPPELQESINAGLSAYQNPPEAEEEEYQRPADGTFYAEDYPARPEGPGIGTQIRAGARSLAQTVGLIPEDEQSEAQKQVAEYEQRDEAAMADRESIYQYTGRPAEVAGVQVGNMRVQEGKIANPDFDPTQPESEENPAYKYQKMYVPQPDTNMATRMSGELLTRTAEGLGDFIIDQKFLEEGTVGKLLPNMPQGSGEALATEIMSYLIPGLGAKKAAEGTVKLSDNALRLYKSLDPEYVKLAKETFESAVKNGESITEAGSKAKNIVTSGIAAIYAGTGEAMIAPEGAQGFMLEGSDVAEITGMNEDNAKATALFLENSAFGAALKGLTTVLGFGWKAVKNKASGAKRFSAGATRGMYEDVHGLRVLTALDPELTEGPAEVVAMRMRILAEEVATNKVVDVLEGQGKNAVNVRLDSTNALIQSTRNYLRRAYAYKIQDLGKEGFEDWVDSKSVDMANNMLVLRSSEAGNPGVIASEARMMDDISGGLGNLVDEQVQKSGYGSVEEAANATADELVALRGAELDRANAVIDSVDQELKQLEEIRANGLLDDPDLGPLLSKVEGVGNIGLTKELTDRMKAVMGDDVYTAWKSDFDAVNAAYARLPDGVPIDAKGLALSIQDATETLYFVETTGKEARNLMGSLALAFKLPKSVLKDIEGDKAEAFFAKLQQKMDGPKGVDAKYLYNNVKPRLEELIQGTENKQLRDRLIQLKKSITTDQLEFIAETGNPQVADMAREADRAFKSYTNRWQPDPDMPMGQFDEAARARATAETRFAKERDPDVLAQGQEKFATVSNRAVDAMSSDLMGAGFDPVIRAVKGSIDKDMGPEFADYYASLALKSLSDAVAAGNPQNLATLNSALTAYLPKLEALNSPLVPKIKQAQVNLQTLESGIADATQVAEELRAGAQAAKDATERSVVNKLVSDVGINIPRQDADNVIAGIFKGPDAVNQMNALMAKVKELPEEQALAGLTAIKAVALRTASQKIFTYSKGAVTALGDSPTAEAVDSVRTANRASIKTTTDILANETDKTLSALGVVFKDDPFALESYVTLLRTLDVVSVPANVKYTIGSDTEALRQMASAADTTGTAIVLGFGVLNPTATMARNLSRGTTAALDARAKEISDDVMAKMMGEPEAIIEAARRLARGEDPTSVSNYLARVFDKGTREGIRVTSTAGARAPERTDKQEMVDDPEGYQQYLDQQMREIIGIQ